MRTYERPTVQQMLETSKMLAPPNISKQQLPPPVQQKLTFNTTPLIPAQLFALCSFNNSVIQIQVGESSTSTNCSIDNETKAILEELEDVNIEEFSKTLENFTVALASDFVYDSAWLLSYIFTSY